MENVVPATKPTSRKVSLRYLVLGFIGIACIVGAITILIIATHSTESTEESYPLPDGFGLA